MPGQFRAVLAALVAAGLALALSTTAHAAAQAAPPVAVKGLRIDQRADQPIGVDDTTPTFSWTLSGRGAVARQTAYEVKATDASGAVLWDSGKVASSRQQATYAGASLTSRAVVSWQVRAWDGADEASNWSTRSTFEMGLLGGWGSAKWISMEPPAVNRPVVISLGEQNARYVRLDVTKLGLPVAEGALGMVSRLQLAELRLLDDSGTNVAAGAAVSASNPYQAGGWSNAGLTDGVLTTPGYTSLESKTQDVNPSDWVQLDLGSVKLFSQIALYPRTDLRTADGQVPNFPVDFTIQTSPSDPSTLSTVKTVTGEPTPPGPGTQNSLPIFARPFTAEKPVVKARLYMAGLGAYEATIDGKPVTDTVLNPGVTNPLREVEAGDYDVTTLVQSGDNTLGVALGNGQTDVYTQPNGAVGRTGVYEKFTSVPPPSASLAAPAAAGDTTVKLTSVGGLTAGSTLNVDTGDGGTRLESHTIAAVGTAGPNGTGVTLTSALTGAHATGSATTGSGAATQPGIAVSPRLIARLELTYADGSTNTIISDPNWRAKHGPTTTDNWYAGSDFDARAVQAGWDEPGADLSDAQGWKDAWITSPPSLQTKLVWRQAPPVRVEKAFHPVSVNQPKPGVWVFNMGQNFAGMEQLHLDGGKVPAGTVIKLQPSELLKADGTVDPSSTGSATGIYDTYTASGGPNGETFTPQFVYHGFQYIQVTGLPDGYTPATDTVVGLQTHADVPTGGSVNTSDSLINTIHSMSQYSIMSNMQSIFTDCPHREKLGWLADMIQSMGAIHSDYDVSSFLRGVERNMASSQQTNGLIPDIAPELTVFGGGFRDEVNWGDAFILTPYFLYTTYGDDVTMREYYAQMQDYVTYLRSRASNGLLSGDLGDWIAGDGSTPATATGTYGYYTTVSTMAKIADALGKPDDAASYTALAASIANTFNSAFYNPTTQSYTTAGPNGTSGSQAMDALPLQMGIVPAGAKDAVLSDLVARINAYHPNGGGPHISGGTVSLQPIYEVLMNNGRGDVLWDVLQQTTAPSYANFVAHGRTTIPEAWDFGGSQNHMILLQIDEWFNAGLAGIQQAPGSIGFDKLIIKPQAVGSLTHVAGTYETPHGTVSSQWTKGAHGVTEMKVSVPAGSTATVYVPASADQNFVATGDSATPAGRADGYEVFNVQPGNVTFH